MVRWVLSLLLAAGPALAMVDSPRLEEVTCQGLRVRQSGLPAATAFVVEVSDPQSGRELARRQARSDAAGRLDTRIAVRFDAVSQLAVEVEGEGVGQEVELAEAIHEFDRPCPAGRSPAGRTGVVVAALLAVVVLVLGLAVGGRVLRVLRQPRNG